MVSLASPNFSGTHSYASTVPYSAQRVTAELAAAEQKLQNMLSVNDMEPSQLIRGRDQLSFSIQKSEGTVNVDTSIQNKDGRMTYLTKVSGDSKLVDKVDGMLRAPFRVFEAFENVSSSLNNLFAKADLPKADYQYSPVMPKSTLKTADSSANPFARVFQHHAYKPSQM